jgi:hypothetical protein
MSMNIYIGARRQIQVLKTGKLETQYIRFQEWQTPTRTTYEILEEKDKLAAYKAWVLSISQDEIVTIYGVGDIFCERAPIGEKTINLGKEHVAALEAWVADCEEQGYEIEVESM